MGKGYIYIYIYIYTYSKICLKSCFARRGVNAMTHKKIWNHTLMVLMMRIPTIGFLHLLPCIYSASTSNIIWGIGTRCFQSPVSNIFILFEQEAEARIRGSLYHCGTLVSGNSHTIYIYIYIYIYI